MINFVSSDGLRVCVALSGGEIIVGRGQIRNTVRCEIIGEDHNVLSTGVSMCHPVDQFDPRKGAHLALKAAAEGWFDKADISALHKKVDAWF